MTKIKIAALAALLATGVFVYGQDIRPVPQRCVADGTTVAVTRTVNLVVEDGVPQVSVDRLMEVLGSYGIAATRSSSPTDSQTNILLGVNGSGGAVDAYADTHGVDRSVFDAAGNRFDQHLIRVNGNHANGDILVLGNGDGSEFYAMASLDQLLKPTGGESLPGLEIDDYAHTRFRGIVEGFYGIPYSTETISELLRFCKRYKMNTFIYGPKSDPYHLGQWREDYPTQLTEQQEHNGVLSQDDFRAITREAEACNVDFVWAIHPALQNGISFSSEAGIDQGVSDIMEKFAHMYELGVRGFGVFIDDMTYTPSGALQARLADQTQKRLREAYGSEGEDGVAPLFFVPTAYALNYGASYTLYDLADVDDEVVIAFTGYDCFSNIRGLSCADMASRVGRNAVMWWNNPVNDDHDERLYMRELTTHWTIEDDGPINTMLGLVLNPMTQGNASKVALFGAADYSWNPGQFDATDSWEAFFDFEYEDAELRDALRLFAANSDALVEDSELTALYETFRSEYTPGVLPSCAATLLEKARAINDACIKLEGMEGMDDPRCSLMYADIAPWVAKLKSMTGIICDAITYMMNADETAWTLSTKIKMSVNSLHNDSAHIVRVFEGSGNDVTVRYQEAFPSQQKMEPFVEYIAGLIDDFSISLPERAEGAEPITNLDALPGSVEVDERLKTVVLRGLDGITLGASEYVGVNLNEIKEANFAGVFDGLDGNLQLQHSVSGKEWMPASDVDDGGCELAYFRIKNISESDAAVVTVDSLAITFEEATGFEDATPSTNMGTYDTYDITNVVDGAALTFFWSDAAQEVGDYIMLDFGGQSSRHQVSLQFNGPDRPSGETSVEVSNDASDWEEIASFTRDDLDGDGRFVCDAGGKVVRYVRMVLKSVTTQEWLQVAEFTVETSSGIAQAVDEDGVYVPCLSDRLLDDAYLADGAGQIVYRFIENIRIDSVAIYQNTDFTQSDNAPAVSLLADGKWGQIGALAGNTTVFDVSETDSISALKLEWDSDNIPSLVEIYPVGKPYVEHRVEPEDPDVGIAPLDDVNLSRDGSVIGLRGIGDIETVTVWTVDGVKVFEARHPGLTIQVDEAHANDVLIVRLRLVDGTDATVKL